MKILFTGGRAPVTLELVRNFGMNGWAAYVADSIGHYLSKYSRYAKAAYIVNPLRFREDAFIDDLIHIINENKIDVLFPTCEEIFRISKNKDKLSENCNVQIICDDIDKLSLLHNKYRMIEFAKSENILVPETHIFRQGETPERKSVIKPVFSRFGEDAVIVENQSDIEKIDFENRQYIIQEFIDGEPVCSYGYAVDGALKFNICYKSPFRARTFTAFEPFECDAVNEIVRAVVNRLHFTGNISFDFIKQDDGYFLIECNPRITSGIHTLRNNPFDKLFFAGINKPVLNSAQLLLPTLAGGLRFLPYSDVVWSVGDLKPFWGQIKCLMEFGAIARKHGITLTKAMTYDIEWNGDKRDFIAELSRYSMSKNT